MFVEVIHDAQGNITDCYVSQHLAADGVALMQKEIPVGYSHVRLNVDTLTMLEILDAKKDKAGIGKNGNPVIIKGKKTGAEIIRTNYVVDVNKAQIVMPTGLPMRELKKKI